MTSVPGQSTLRLQHSLLTAVLLGALIAVAGVGLASILSPKSAAFRLSPASLTIAQNERAVIRRVKIEPSSAFPVVTATPLDRDTTLYKRAPMSDVSPAETVLADTIAPTNSRSDMPVPPQPAVDGLAKVAIIIDDMGHSARHSGAALKLPREVALALLPYAPASKSLAQRANARGQELIVHMPMQPKDARTNPGPKYLKADANAAELRQTIAWNLDQFDGYYAVNNHMGSAFTESQAAMQILFEELSARGLAFYDSRTTASSASVNLAARYDVEMAERDVFLDNEIEAGAVDKQLVQLEKLALRNGSAIAIGHPHTVTFEQITLWAKTLEGKGLVLVPPSQILVDRGTPYWRNIIRTAGRSEPSKAETF